MTPQQRRHCIEVLGFTQTGFARFIGRDPATIRRWFTGARAPEPEMDRWLLHVARYMACSPPPGCATGVRFAGFRETCLQPAEALDRGVEARFGGNIT